MRRASPFLQVVFAALLLAGAPLCAHAKVSRHKEPPKTAAPADVKPAEPSTEAHDAAAEGHEAAGAAEPGLPQLDPSHFPGQAFWLVISFGLLYGLMRYAALPKVEQTLEKRAAFIDSALADAKHHNEEAKRLAADIDLRMADARNRAQDQVKEVATAEAKKMADALAEQQKKLDEQMKSAQARLEAQKKEALAQLDSNAGAMVEAIVKQLAGVSPSADQVTKAWKAVKEA
jgi:F-type H+-transporting ATPase subunit b